MTEPPATAMPPPAGRPSDWRPSPVTSLGELGVADGRRLPGAQVSSAAASSRSS